MSISECKLCNSQSKLEPSHDDVPTKHIPLSPGSTQPTYRGPNLFDRLRDLVRAPMAEFFGACIFVGLGIGSSCQVVLSSNPAVTSSAKGSFLSINFGWAIGLGLAVWTSAGISGGHINPAITIAMATWGKFPWKKVPFYIFAQLVGATIGAALAYGQYIHAIDLFEGGHNLRTRATASLFVSFPMDYMTAASSFFSEFLGTAILAFVIMATTDKGNAAPPLGLFPLVIFLTLLGLSLGFGMQTSFSFNPARDFGPRLFLTMAGYGDVYSFKAHYWFWGAILAPIAGSVSGAGLYHLFLRQSDEQAQLVHPDNDKMDA